MTIEKNRSERKCFAFILVIILYYVIHEGAHLIYSLGVGSLKQINFMQLGVQIEVLQNQMSDLQLAFFALQGRLLL